MEFNKILVAVDFSSVSDKALKAAITLAKGLNASLHVIHIVQIHAANMPPEGGIVFVEELQAKEEAEAKAKLEKIVQDLTGGELEVSTGTHSGDPARAVNEVAKQISADLIVMGTHGRTGISHLLMGSVAESVLKKSEIPVMCIRG